jgi:hypothetical protein
MLSEDAYIQRQAELREKFLADQESQRQKAFEE